MQTLKIDSMSHDVGCLQGVRPVLPPLPVAVGMAVLGYSNKTKNGVWEIVFLAGMCWKKDYLYIYIYEYVLNAHSCLCMLSLPVCLRPHQPCHGETGGFQVYIYIYIYVPLCPLPLNAWSLQDVAKVLLMLSNLEAMKRTAGSFSSLVLFSS